ncbi:metallophosphoesterase family protein [Halobacillus locisalis]|uniref:Metallophosphoesterase family protein n=1 Tax=Halobacillus locisalis TaxID=220753 RepID=A0A838CT74_9BACI|nr:metallophosphoesterase family protein [Halobacillus locisalis]MBA2175141.1 metallophosphoesterase family protein [Halobacillus locisalis]
MRIAIMADVHGNASALNAVLKRIDEKDSVDHIYCLGDMIGIGPDTNEVLHSLFSREDISMVTGNHDEAIIALAKGESHPESHAHAREHHEWIADRLDPVFISKLERLPRTILKDFHPFKFRFTHYPVPSEREGVHISKDPFASIVKPGLKNMENLYKEYTEDFIAFGHHHPTHYFKNEKTMYLNPGSLGCSHTPEARYAIVDIEEDHIDTKVEKQVYDKTSFLASYHDLKVPARETLLKIFHGV